jgi:AraC-like DNA-binding protein
MGHRARAPHRIDCQIAPATSYREFAAAPELSDVVRSFFSFMPYAPRAGTRRLLREELIGAREPFNLPMLADARSSIVLDLANVCDVDLGWSTATRPDGRVIGPRRLARQPAADDRAAMVGAYLEPGATWRLFGMPASELTDQSWRLDDFWGTRSRMLLADALPLDETSRVSLLEEALLACRGRQERRGSVNVLAMTAWVQNHPTNVSVDRLARMAGVSRRHLARLFESAVGVTPKRFCRLARFKTGLAYAGAGPGVPWAQVADELGYADQSHMIAEFGELAGLTPAMLATRPWFHPFILETQPRARSIDHARRTAEPEGIPVPVGQRSTGGHMPRGWLSAPTWPALEPTWL